MYKRSTWYIFFTESGELQLHQRFEGNALQLEEQFEEIKAGGHCWQWWIEWLASRCTSAASGIQTYSELGLETRAGGKLPAVAVSTAPAQLELHQRSPPLHTTL